MQVLGLVCERKLHKQPFEGLGLGVAFMVAFNFSCCYSTADFSFFLYPCPYCYLRLLLLCQEPSSAKPHLDIPKVFVNVEYH